MLKILNCHNVFCYLFQGYRGFYEQLLLQKGLSMLLPHSANNYPHIKNCYIMFIQMAQ
jgi:hypothetical protein